MTNNDNKPITLDEATGRGLIAGARIWNGTFPSQEEVETLYKNGMLVGRIVRKGDDFIRVKSGRLYPNNNGIQLTGVSLVDGDLRDFTDRQNCFWFGRADEPYFFGDN